MEDRLQMLIQHLEADKGRLDTLKQNIINAITKSYKKNIPIMIEDCVLSQSAITKSLGLEQLSKIKIQMKDLIAKSDEIINAQFCDCDFWLTYDTDNVLEVYNCLKKRNSFEMEYIQAQQFSQGMKKAYEYVISILVSYGYISYVPNGKGRYLWEINSNAQIKVCDDYLHMNDFQAEIGMYNNYAINTIQRINDFVQEKKKLDDMDAKHLWDQN